MAAKKKTKKVGISDTLAQLLPEGLDTKLIGKIANLLSDKINEEVEKANQTTIKKVTAFIRGNIDRLKEHAVKELELENDTFRNAQLFETVRSLMAVELAGEDETNAINVLASLSEQQDQKSDVLVKEIDRLLGENIKLKNGVKALHTQNLNLNEQVTELGEEVESLSENAVSNGKSLSDSAVMISAENFKKKTKTEPADNSITERIVESENEWLDPSVMEALDSLSDNRSN
tara:strand:- start:405 stop:1100 length:696 start_codon:yes stop_codon:yes gene_type:complete